MNLRTLLAAAYMTFSSCALAVDPIVVDFEQFPSWTSCPPPTYISDRGANFSAALVESAANSPNLTKTLRTFQSIYNFTCTSNPLVINFDEPVSELKLDMYSRNSELRIRDDRGWSQVVFTGGHHASIEVPSTDVRRLEISDPCNYWNASGCDEIWQFYIDNVSFKPERYCLEVTGPSTTEPNGAGRSDKSIALVVEVTDCDGQPVPDIAVRTLVSVEHTSGGHSAGHPLPIPRPPGGLRGTSDTSGAENESYVGTSDALGQIAMEFVPPEAAGTHTINATCVVERCYEPDPPLEVEVGIEGLAAIPADNLFYTLKEYLDGTDKGKNIGNNGQHDNLNHHLTPEAAEVLSRVAFEYAARLYFFPVPEKLHINDASLPNGGLFDFRGQWRPDHRGHRKGTVVDIRANQAPGAIPVVFRTEFELAAIYNGALALFESFPDASNDHYHVLLMGVPQ